MIEKNGFGSTGHNSTRILFGAAALGKVSQEEADQTLEMLIKYGINHLDTAASYGEAELRMGPWMAFYRRRFFLATKTEERSYDGAMRELEASLKRLQTDVIDLWQMHVLVDEPGWQTAMGENGALKAFRQAQEQGVVRFLGVTGHGVQAPRFHLRSLEEHPFDAVLLPWNYPMSLNKEYAADFLKLKTVCASRGVAVQTIKSLCRRPWPEGSQNRATWYQPLEDSGDIDRAVSYILSDPQLFLNSVGDIHLLPLVLESARKFSEGLLPPVSEEEMAELVQKRDMAPLFC